MTDRIRAAIEVLARTGWTKQAFTDEDGRHCLQGALYEAHGLVPRCDDQPGVALRDDLAADVRAVNEVIQEQYPDRFGAVGISRFNDHQETTVDDVVRVLEKAAVRNDELA